MTPVADSSGIKAAVQPDVTPSDADSASLGASKPSEQLLALRSDHASARSVKVVKERRQGLGDNVIKEQIKRLIAPGDGQGLHIVSDSEDDWQEDPEAVARVSTRELPPGDVFDAITEALQRNFIFRGIRTPALTQVVSRMFKMEFASGKRIIQQGDAPSSDDCLFFLERGAVNVIIAGNVERAQAGDEVVATGANHLLVKKDAGWVFGDLTMLFNAPRTASVEAATDAVLWAMDRRTFHSFVMAHAHGARAVKFLRKLPLLKGVADGVLVDIAGRVKEEVYESGEHLIRAGDRADGLYVIRYGQVRVQIGARAVATLGRGHFVGERTLVTGKLRSADCIAEGRVVAIVMQKRDFLEVHNPLLDWMLPYDAARAVLKPAPELRELKTAAFEQLLDRFGPKVEEPADTVLCAVGQTIDRLIVFISGDVELRDAAGEVVPHDGGRRDGFFQEDHGFSSYGLRCLSELTASPYTVTIKSNTASFIVLKRKDVDDILGVAANTTLVLSEQDKDFAKSVLGQSHMLSKLPAAQLAQLVDRMTMLQCVAGQIVVQMGTLADHVHILQHGECIVSQRAVNGDTTLAELRAVGHAFMCHGDFYGEIMLVKRQKNPASVVAVQQGTTLLTLSIEDVMAALDVASAEAASESLMKLAVASYESAKKSKSLDFAQLQFHRIVGTGQFGAVRLVTHRQTKEVYALKVLHKQPISEGKQVEHIMNELTVMETSKHPFCVQLKGAYHDQDCLYLLMEWVPGGELFHHLDLRGSFDEATAQFYAANVLTALDYLHSKGIIYRDLKPENLLLDAQGYVKLADFGFAKHVGTSRTFTICGTPDYQAPEVIMRRGTTKAVDYWALGVLIFEMLVGEPPFMSASGDPWDTFRRSMTGRCQVPSFVSEQAANLIYKLLQVNPERRLGTAGAREVRQHPWFVRMDWQMLEAKKLRAPIVPTLADSTDTSNFDNFDQQIAPPPKNTRNDRNIWQLWEWVDTQGLNIHDISSSSSSAPQPA